MNIPLIQGIHSTETSMHIKRCRVEANRWETVTELRLCTIKPSLARPGQWVFAINDYRMGKYRAAVDEIVTANAPDVFWTHWLLAAAYGQLGDLEAASNALRDLRAQKEGVAQAVGQLLDKWFGPQLDAHMLEGLRKAGPGDGTGQCHRDTAMTAAHSCRGPRSSLATRRRRRPLETTIG